MPIHKVVAIIVRRVEAYVESPDIDTTLAWYEASDGFEFDDVAEDPTWELVGVANATKVPPEADIWGAEEDLTEGESEEGTKDEKSSVSG